MAASSDPVAELKELVERRREMKERLVILENQIYTIEGTYLSDTQAWGNIFKGWEGYIANKAPGSVEKKNRKIKESDRLFSLSSCTAPQGTESSNAAAPVEVTEPESGGDDYAVVEKKKRKKYMMSTYGKGQRGKGKYEE